jgi:sugar/nucleoside kinase (ribokinase family)
MTKNLIGIGNAAVDAVVHVPDDAALDNLNLEKGGCVFANDGDAIMARALTQYPDRLETPGGAAANALASYAALGGRARFIGKAGQDAHGEFFKQSMQDFNIAYDTAPTLETQSTFLFAFVTPDKERTFLSNHGASHKIETTDVNEAWFSPDTSLIMDGYMLMSGGGPAAMFQAMDYAKKHDSEIIFMPCSLSVIDHNRAMIDEIIDRSHAIICNEDEAKAIACTVDLDQACQRLYHGGDYDWGVVTIGALGAFYFKGNQSGHVNIPYRPDFINNTNGAGDAFSGGLIYGLHHDMDIEDATTLGHHCAIHVIQQDGPRPAGWLNHLLTCQKTA